MFNGAEALGECLASLARWRPEASDIVLVDDASTDERIAPMLSAFAAAHAGVTVLAMPANQGFVRAANRGAQVHAQSDALFLNSDTVVTEGWLDAMRAALEGDPRVAICCPLSNNASLLSVPRFQQENDLPEGLDADAMARLVRESAGEPAQLELPTCVGFCMLVRREAWERWGPFDEAFGAGYGEEDDLAQRVRRDGGRIACASNAFVFHRGGASFGTSQALLARRRVNAAMLLARWPGYSDCVRTFCESNPLRPPLERLWDALMTRAQAFERHVVHVVHRWDETGGIQYHVRDLARATHPVARHTVVVPVHHLEAWRDLYEHTAEGNLRVVGIPHPDSDIERHAFRQWPGNALEERFAKYLSASTASIVHFHSFLGWNSLALARIAKSSGRSVVITLHDYLLLCPNYNFGRPDGTSCAKKMHLPHDADCRACLAKFAGVPTPRPDEPGGFARHAQAALSVLESADAIVVPSEHVRERYRRAWGDQAAARMRRIAHASVAPVLPVAHTRSTPGRFVATFLGNAIFAKGGDLFIEAARQLQDQGIAFNVVGTMGRELAGAAQQAGVTASGTYRREEIERLTAESSVLCILSRFEETYCLTLDEAQSTGLPVIATSAGAIAERADRRQVTLIPPGNFAAFTRALIAARDAWKSGRKLHPPAPVEGDGREYRELYRSLAAALRAGGAQAPQALPLPPPVFAAAVVVPAAPVASGNASALRVLRVADAPGAPLPSLPDDPEAWLAIAAQSDDLHEGWQGAFEAARARQPGALAFFFDDELRTLRGERYAARSKPGFDPRLAASDSDLLDGLCVIKRSALFAGGGLEPAPAVACARALTRIAASHGDDAVAHIPWPAASRLDARVNECLRHLALARLLDAPRPGVSVEFPPSVRAVVLCPGPLDDAVGALAGSLLALAGVYVEGVEIWQVGAAGSQGQPHALPHPRVSWHRASSLSQALAETSQRLTADWLLVALAGLELPSLDVVRDLIARTDPRDAAAAPRVLDRAATPREGHGYLEGADRCVGEIEAACALLRRAALVDVGPLATLPDWCSRARGRKWRIARLGSIAVRA